MPKRKPTWFCLSFFNSGLCTCMRFKLTRFPALFSNSWLSAGLAKRDSFLQYNAENISIIGQGNLLKICGISSRRTWTTASITFFFLISTQKQCNDVEFVERLCCFPYLWVDNQIKSQGRPLKSSRAGQQYKNFHILILFWYTTKNHVAYYKILWFCQ